MENGHKARPELASWFHAQIKALIFGAVLSVVTSLVIEIVSNPAQFPNLEPKFRPHVVLAYIFGYLASHMVRVIKPKLSEENKNETIRQAHAFYDILFAFLGLDLLKTSIHLPGPVQMSQEPAEHKGKVKRISAFSVILTVLFCLMSACVTATTVLAKVNEVIQHFNQQEKKPLPSVTATPLPPSEPVYTERERVLLKAAEDLLKDKSESKGKKTTIKKRKKVAPQRITGS